jgi:two-component system phosphate regulon sensor histidine kinase PhoR
MSQNHITPSLRRELALLTTWIFFMLLLGSVTDSVFVFLLIALAVYVIWHLYNLNKLHKWLTNPSKKTPEVFGIWDDVYYQLYHLFKRQRKARRKLTSILNRFQKSTQALPYSTIVLNESNEIEWFNPAARQMFSLHSGIDVGQRIDNLIRQPRFVSYLIKKDFKKPLKFQLHQSKIILSITPYGSGQYLISARDITSLSQLDDMRRDFISNASHELRTPLTVMSGYIEFLQHNADDKIKIPLENIQQQTVRMNKIITELIDLAKLESAAAVDYTNVIDINTLLNDVYDEAVALDQDRHHLELVIENESPDNSLTSHLNGSYEELRMAFSNLLTNAIRYTPEGENIKLFATSHDTGVTVGVQDKGVGINYEHIPRLTERFYRVDEGRSREQGGTGLGLAIVKHVLDRHNAHLQILSEPGQGSTFCCEFPLTYEAY